MSIQTLNFDTINSLYTNSDPFDTTFTMSNPLRNIKKIRLSSLEIPLGFYNIRSTNSTNTFTITINSVVSTITLSPAYYSSISTLLTAINTAFTALSLTNTPTFSYNGLYVIITLTTSTTYSITSSNLSKYVLGFSSTTSGTGKTLTATNPFNLSYDTYFIMYFPNLPVNNNSATQQILHFKLPISGINGAVYYYYENFGLTQELQITDSNYIINNVRVVFYDRFGCTVSNYLDYSMSLTFEYEP